MSQTLDGALKNNGFRCLCSERLTFEPGIKTVACHCLRCQKKSQQDGAVIYVRGHGTTEQAAYDDWRELQRSF